MHNKADKDKVKKEVIAIVNNNSSGAINLTAIYKTFGNDENNLQYALKEYKRIIKNMYI